MAQNDRVNIMELLAQALFLTKYHYEVGMDRVLLVTNSHNLNKGRFYQGFQNQQHLSCISCPGLRSNSVLSSEKSKISLMLRSLLICPNADGSFLLPCRQIVEQYHEISNMHVVGTHVLYMP